MMEVWTLIGCVFLVGCIRWWIRELQCTVPSAFWRWIPFIGPWLGAIYFVVFEMKKRFGVLIDRAKSLGKTWQVLGLYRRTVVTADPDIADYILKTNFNNYIKGSVFTAHMKDLLGDGIFNVNGSAWKKQRQVASHMFKGKELRHMLHVFLSHGQLLLEKLNEYAKSGEVVDTQDLFSRFTLDSMMEVAFGTKMHSLQTQVPFAQAFNTATTCTALRFTSPFVGLAHYYGFTRIFKSERDLAEAIAQINTFVYGIIDQRRNEIAKGAIDTSDEDKLDLLTRYMLTKDENGEPFSTTYLRDIVLNFILAGRDTTAQTLTWTFYLLAKNPIAQQKVVDEIENTLHGAAPDFETIKNMPYLRAAIDETLRLYPPVPFDPKNSVQADVLPNGMRVPANCGVAWSAWIMGRMHDVYENPDDFVPERWLDTKYNGGKTILPQNFIPFQAGPRICLGQQMAYLEVKTVMILLLKDYELKLVPDQVVEPGIGITICAANGCKMTVHKRYKK